MKKNEDPESFFDLSKDGLVGYAHLFPDETRFPVLMLSFVGPQHGRLFYACMNGEIIVIRQSKLYSSEQQTTAPLDLFARLLLSRPLKLDESRPQPAAKHKTRSQTGSGKKKV